MSANKICDDCPLKTYYEVGTELATLNTDTKSSKIALGALALTRTAHEKVIQTILCQGYKVSHDGNYVCPLTDVTMMIRNGVMFNWQNVSFDVAGIRETPVEGDKKQQNHGQYL